MDSLVNQYGHEDSLFTSDVPDYLHCIICTLVLRDPVQILQCGHKYCHVCFERIKQQALRTGIDLLCPVDREIVDLNAVHPDVGMGRIVGNLTVRCREHENGCSWNGDLRQLDTHHQECQHRIRSESSVVTVTDDVFREFNERLDRYETALQEKDKKIASLDLKQHQQEQQLQQQKQQLQQQNYELQQQKQKQQQLHQEKNEREQQHQFFLDQNKFLREEVSQLKEDFHVLRKEVTTGMDVRKVVPEEASATPVNAPHNKNSSIPKKQQEQQLQQQTQQLQQQNYELQQQKQQQQQLQQEKHEREKQHQLLLDQNKFLREEVSQPKEEDHLLRKEVTSGIDRRKVMPEEASATPVNVPHNKNSTIPKKQPVAKRKIVVQHHSGLRENVIISDSYHRVEFKLCSTVSARAAVVPLGAKVWYEVHYPPLRASEYHVDQRIGWATNDLESSESHLRTGVGDSTDSYAFNPFTGEKCHGGTTPCCKTLQWSDGSYVGIALDTIKGEILFSINGDWNLPNGIAFSGVDTKTQFFPAFSGQYRTLEVNFGDREFRYGPPTSGFVNLVDVL